MVEHQMKVLSLNCASDAVSINMLMIHPHPCLVCVSFCLKVD